MKFLGMTWFGETQNFEVSVPREITQQGTGINPIKVNRTEALSVPAVKRSRDLIAGSLSSLPMHLRNKDREEVTGSDAPTTLFDQVDPNIPNIVTYAETYEDLFFEGVSWWRVLERNFDGWPTFAEHISPGRVHISNMPLPIVTGFYPPASGQPAGRLYIDGYPVRDEDVIRFDSPNPAFLTNAARAVRTCITLDQAANAYASEPVPMGYFTPKEGERDPSDEKVVGILDRWAASRRQRIWGYVNSTLELKQLQFNAEQIQLADQRQHAVLEISRAAGIDPEYLGVSTTSRTYQNAEQERQNLLDFTLRPYMAAVEQRLSMKDVTPRGWYVRANLDAFLRGDTKTRLEAYAIGEPLGLYPPDRLAELEDIPRVRKPKPVSPPQLTPVPDEEVQSAR